MKARLLAAVVVGMISAAACSARTEDAVSRPTLVPTVAPGQTIPWAAIPPVATPAERPPTTIVPSLEVPGRVSAGEVLRYELMLENTGETPYAPAECPVYVAWLRSQSTEPINVAGETLTLNCAPAGTLKPGTGARFAMELLVPAQTPAGRWSLAWSFMGPAGPFGPVAEAQVEIRAR